MARFHADENFPLAVVRLLRLKGHEVLTAYEAGRAGQGIPDDAVLEFAASNGLAVLTINRRDYFKLHRAGVGHAGIVACTDNRNLHQFADQIHAAVTAVGDLQNALVRVYRRPQQG